MPRAFRGRLGLECRCSLHNVLLETKLASMTKEEKIGLDNLPSSSAGKAIAICIGRRKAMRKRAKRGEYILCDSRC